MTRFNDIRPGDRVTILVPAGGSDYASKTGRATLVFPTHAVINLGGRFGTPGIADANSYVRHTTPKVKSGAWL